MTTKTNIYSTLMATLQPYVTVYHRPHPPICYLSYDCKSTQLKDLFIYLL